MRIWALAKRIVKQVIRDKRTVALLFVAPLLVLWLLSLVFTTSDTKSTIDLVEAPPVIVDKFKEIDAVVQQTSLPEAEQRLQDGKTDGYIEFALPKLKVVLEGSDPIANKAVMQTVQQVAQNLAPANGVLKNLVEVSYLHGGSSLTMLDYFAPVLIGFFIFFFVFLISGVSFLRERTGGTLERILATPIKRYEIVLGYFFGFGLFAVLQTAIVQWFALKVLGVQSVGSFGSVLVINILLATVALSLGSLLSTFARNEFQMVQFIPLVVIPQVFLSGLFDLRGMPEWVIGLSKLMPLTHASEALRGAIIRGQSLLSLHTSLWILLGYCAIFLLLNVLTLKRYRKV
ncbi:ABC transporter permease [Effusibacillus pohliae]|uniref:ABC transporter permease n=1 Tax=Effusibacillus pohliae TaxID=232270 RepID=UPI00035C4F49|nr:ABC transporter permease [Effusibacillus pohliae]